MKNSELKPCPFCGSASKIISNRGWHRVCCLHDEGCIIGGHEIMCPAMDEHRLNMVEDWNRRACNE
ncbi:Lar family restriction alleviation protein [Pectobacterium carotovorum]|uniref:Lar family restriction alleviation protein n=1 Tax=Pectobacterium carotovorum TaxID=554 RepID=UPI003AFA576A